MPGMPEELPAFFPATLTTSPPEPMHAQKPPRPASRVPRLLAALVLPLAFPACKPSPCTVCATMIHKGASLRPYLASHPAPYKVTPRAGGGTTYEWVYTRREEVPNWADPALAPANRPSSSGGTRGAVGELLLAALTWDGKDHNPSPAPPATVQRRFYVVRVETDADGLVLAYACESVQAEVPVGFPG